MKTLKLILQALLGLILSCAAALAVSTWAFSGEKDELAAFGSLRLSISGLGAGAALLMTLAFADGWIGERKRRGGSSFPGTLLNGLGFGLLPGAAVYKIFEQTTFRGAGRAVPEGIPALPWVTENGLYQPCRLEMILALTAFLAVVIWIAFRRNELPENGDMAGISAALWGCVRLITEGFRAREAALCGTAGLPVYLLAGLMLMILVLWTGRAAQNRENTGYALACFPVFLAGTAVIVLQETEVLRVNPAADLAIRGSCALLALKAVICMGRVSRPR